MRKKAIRNFSFSFTLKAVNINKRMTLEWNFYMKLINQLANNSISIIVGKKFYLPKKNVNYAEVDIHTLFFSREMRNKNL